MRTTVNIDDELLAKASKLTGPMDRTAISILVDTTVWVDHLRRGDAGLVDLLERSVVGMHPFVVGELAGGNLRERE